MVFVDFHCHLDWESYGDERFEIAEKMKKKGIIALTNTLNSENYAEVCEMFKDYDNIKVCPGLYPQDSEKISDTEFKNYLKLIKDKKDEFIAIGEIGLDRHHTTSPKLWKIQEKRFRALVELGIKIDKPLIIHTRKAEEVVLTILKEYVEKHNFRKFNLHCFSGKKKLIKTIKELQIYCSIPYIIKNTQSFQILVEELPITQLLVETDSPFLHPRKIRNSPLSVPFIYEEIARIKGYDKKEIENIIYSNFQRITMQ